MNSWLNDRDKYVRCYIWSWKLENTTNDNIYQHSDKQTLQIVPTKRLSAFCGFVY